MDRARDHYSTTEAGLLAERKEREEGVRSVHARTEGRQTLSSQLLIPFDNNASDAEVITDTKKSRKLNHKMQSPEFTCPQRRKEFRQTESEPSLRTSLYAGRMRCKSCQRRWKRELFAKDNLSLERTKSNTPKYTGSQNSNVVSMPQETESNLLTWNFDPIPSESSNWPDEELQGQAEHAKNRRIQV